MIKLAKVMGVSNGGIIVLEYRKPVTIVDSRGPRQQVRGSKSTVTRFRPGKLTVILAGIRPNTRYHPMIGYSIKIYTKIPFPRWNCLLSQGPRFPS
jgi:hypothetical protein